jgi:hypothetical protein
MLKSLTGVDTCYNNNFTALIRLGKVNLTDDVTSTLKSGVEGSVVRGMLLFTPYFIPPPPNVCSYGLKL